MHIVFSVSVNANVMPSTSQLPSAVSAVTRTAGASFVPTSVIRNMAAGQRPADDQHIKGGQFLSMYTRLCALVFFFNGSFFGSHSR